MKGPSLIPVEVITERIRVIRGHRVMLDFDLAALYGVETRVLNQVVRRNPGRFPPDFVFNLSDDEFAHWRSQIVMSNPKALMGLRRAPAAFTEHGVLMVATLLRSERAIAVSQYIVRAFVRLREILMTHKDLAQKIDSLEAKYDHQFKIVFDAIRQLMTEPETPKGKIGFRTSTDN